MKRLVLAAALSLTIGGITCAAPASAQAKRAAAQPGLVAEGHHLLVVHANFVPGQEESFNRWYDGHMQQIMKLPGAIRCQRFKTEPRAGRPASEWGYVVMYEFTGAIDPFMAEFGKAVKEGRLVAPDKAYVAGTESSAWVAVGPGFVAAK